MTHIEQESDLIRNKLGSCEVCNANPSKYTCPRCEVKTCSLSCVTIHKDELECNGLRDKSLYKPLKKFTNLDLLSDYRLLEDVSKMVTKYHKDVNKRYTRYQQALPIQLYKLKGTAYSRGVRLMFLPQNFSKHKENTTYYDWKTKNLYWRIEWSFLTASGEIKFVDERILDSEKLGTVIAKYLSPVEQIPELESYYAASYNGIALLLKAAKTVGSYHELDICVSLRENLRGKQIIEFPTIYVIPKHQKDEYEIMESDEEEEICDQNNDSEDDGESFKRQRIS